MSLFAELKRRNVFRVAIAYVIAAWLLLQVLDVVIPLLNLPDWVGRFFFLLLAVGLPIALILAWAFELTPEGIRRESEVDRTQSITASTGRRLDFAIIAVLLVALGWFAWDKFGAEKPASEAAAPLTAQMADAPAPEAPTGPVEKSVAVLPFVAMSTGADDGYFADGLTEEILNSLAQLPELLVTARTSAFRFKGEDLPPIGEIAATLGVRHIVEGSVRRAGERLRVTAQLIRADDGFHLWSQNYDSTSSDTIAVQEDIAEQIALALDVVLDNDRREAMRAAGLRDVEAFIAWQKGMDLFGQAHGEIDQIEGLRRANEFFEEVLERVPDYPPAYTRHSDLFIHIINNHVTRQPLPGVTEADIAAAHGQAVADLEQANLHARTPQEQHYTDYDLAFISGNWTGLTGRLERVLADRGCENGAWTNHVANLFGYVERYRVRAAESRACDPLVGAFWFDEARAALWAGDAEAALQIAQRGLEVAPGTWISLILTHALVARGQFDEALREIDARVADPDAVLLYKALVAAGRADRSEFERLRDLYLARDDTSDFWIQVLHAWGGDEQAANALAAAMDSLPNSEIPLTVLAHWCACGAPWNLEATPRYAAKLEQAKLPWPPGSPIALPLKDW